MNGLATSNAHARPCFIPLDKSNKGENAPKEMATVAFSNKAEMMIFVYDFKHRYPRLGEVFFGNVF